MSQTCTCCKKEKKAVDFSWNGKRGIFAQHCRDCGAWLALFRQVFGASRYMDRVRASQREYQQRRKLRQHFALNDAFGIGRAV